MTQPMIEYRHLIENIKPFGFYTILVAAGLLFLLSAERVGKYFSLPPALILLPLFIVANLLAAKFLNLQGDLKTYWGLGKSHTFIWGCVVGASLALMPILIGTIMGKSFPVKNNFAFSLQSAALTLCIIAWEELWFRGLATNYLASKSSPIFAALYASILFTLMHLLNPGIKFLTAAPNLFLGSFILTLGYFHFKSIYFAFGLHFFWNMFGSSTSGLIGLAIPAGPFWGEGGILINILLAIGSLVFLLRLI